MGNGGYATNASRLIEKIYFHNRREYGISQLEMKLTSKFYKGCAMKTSRFWKEALVATVLTGSLCVGGVALAAEQKSDTLNFVNYRDVRDLNPHLYAGEMYAQEMLYETLVDITADGYKPCLAESWDISDDGLVYTIHLREDALRHQGQLRRHPGKPRPPHLAGNDAPAGKSGRA